MEAGLPDKEGGASGKREGRIRDFKSWILDVEWEKTGQ
jgi:hypothetical protein